MESRKGRSLPVNLKMQIPEIIRTGHLLGRTKPFCLRSKIEGLSQFSAEERDRESAQRYRVSSGR